MGIVVGLVLTALSANPKALFLKNSAATGLFGLAILGSLALGRPLTFYFGRRFATDGSKAQRDWWDGLWRHPEFRRVQRYLAAVWGFTLFGEAAIRAGLTWQLGTSAMVTVDNVVPCFVVAALTFYSIDVGRRSQAGALRRPRGDRAS